MSKGTSPAPLAFQLAMALQSLSSEQIQAAFVVDNFPALNIARARDKVFRLLVCACMPPGTNSCRIGAHRKHRRLHHIFFSFYPVVRPFARKATSSMSSASCRLGPRAQRREGRCQARDISRYASEAWSGCAANVKLSRRAKEIAIMKSMDHPNIIKLFETFEAAKGMKQSSLPSWPLCCKS